MNAPLLSRERGIKHGFAYPLRVSYLYVSKSVGQIVYIVHTGSIDGFKPCVVKFHVPFLLFTDLWFAVFFFRLSLLFFYDFVGRPVSVFVRFCHFGCFSLRRYHFELFSRKRNES